MINIEETILSQYANSPIIMSIIDMANTNIDPSANIDEWYAKVWDVSTAEGYGLDVWGRIVGVSRVLELGNEPVLGYKEGGTIDYTPFGQARFFQGTTIGSSYNLSDDAFRVLILVKALANISRCTSSMYNAMLMKLFPGRGNAYVSDIGNMSARLTFEFILQPFELAILKQSGAFSNPTGVQFDIIQIERYHNFGFKEAGFITAGYGFGNGIFFRGFL
jgi:hypothetical protein